MSKLWQSILEFSRMIGNKSGCHQLPERSFFINGLQFPVCARCMGVLIGEVIALVFAIFPFRLKSIKIPLFCMGVMGIDWGMQEAGIKESTNIRRLVTGILGGFGLFSIYILGIKQVQKGLLNKTSHKLQA